MTYNANIAALQSQLGMEPDDIDGINGPKTSGLILKAAESGRVTIAPLPEKAAVSALPWINEILTVFGLHEKKDNAKLAAWLKSDGKTLGDPKALPWCFTGDAEIMTEEGWQRFDSLTAARVYQVDDGGEMSLTHFAPVHKPYSGKIDVIEHNSFTLRADPMHRWWGRWGTTGRERADKPNQFGQLSDMTTQGLSIPVCVSGASGAGLDDRQLTLIAAILSDGTLRRRADGTVREIVFEVSRPHKIEALTSLGPDHVYVQKAAYGPLTVTPLTVFTFKFATWMQDVIGDQKDMHQDFVNSMSVADARKFLSAYRKFDGSQSRFHLYTSGQKRIDHLSQIAVMAGYSFGVSQKESSLSTKPCYEMHIRDNETPRMIFPKNVRQEDFTGDLYCVSVPQGRIVVRERNRAAIVTGNCGDAVETAIKKAVPAEPFPGAVGQNPYFARNWAHFGRPCGLVYGCIGVFSRGPTSGHVGFLIGQDADEVFVLGGNQGDSISVVAIAKSRLLATRWPVTFTGPEQPLPAMSGADIPKSVNEF